MAEQKAFLAEDPSPAFTHEVEVEQCKCKRKVPSTEDYETVTAAGGEVLVIDLVAGCSTTTIIEKILAE